jgi:hypothetical protein
MIADVLGFSIRNLPAFLFVLALAVALLRRHDGALAQRLLSWILLLPIGVTVFGSGPVRPVS